MLLLVGVMLLSFHGGRSQSKSEWPVQLDKVCILILVARNRPIIKQLQLNIIYYNMTCSYNVML